MKKNLPKVKAHPVLVFHVGAGTKSYSDSETEKVQKSLQEYLQKAYKKLQAGASADQVVVEMVKFLEDDPHFNAGRGSCYQGDGKIRMSASLMSGKTSAFSGVINIEKVRHPIAVAQSLQSAKDRVLSAHGALAWAREHHFELRSAYTAKRWLSYRQAIEGKSGTVGAVALDRYGHLAAATSTGGRGMEYPARVSDSATVAGNYANGACAVSATGVGEQIVDYALAARVATLVEAGQSLTSVNKQCLKEVKKRDLQLGWICLNNKGQWAAPFATAKMGWGFASAEAQEIFI